MPPRAPIFNLMGLRAHANLSRPPTVVETVIDELDRILADHGTEILSMLRARHPPHLKDVDKVGIEIHLNHELDGSEIKVLKGETVKESTRREQLFASNVNGVLRQIERVAQGDVARGQLDLGCEGLFGTRGKNDRAMSADPQLELTQEASVVVEEADVGSAWRIDVSGDGGGEKSLSIHQSEIIDFARLKGLIRDTRFDVRVWDRHQSLSPTRRGWLGAHATAGSSGKPPDAGSASATIS